MQAKELAKILLENPDFEVVLRTSNIDEKGFDLQDTKITDVCDVGYSSKIILLEGEIK